MRFNASCRLYVYFCVFMYYKRFLCIILCFCLLYELSLYNSWVLCIFLDFHLVAVISFHMAFTIIDNKTDNWQLLRVKEECGKNTNSSSLARIWKRWKRAMKKKKGNTLPNATPWGSNRLPCHFPRTVVGGHSDHFTKWNSTYKWVSIGEHSNHFTEWDNTHKWVAVMAFWSFHKLKG